MSNTVVTAAEFAGMTFTDECVGLSEGRLVRQALAGWATGRAVASIGAEIEAFVAIRRIGAAARQGAPDLAVEVVSPSDSASELRTKVEQFFRAGTRLVWLVFPTQRQVHVYSGPKQVTILDAHETLTGGDVLPGFSVKVEEFFQ